MVEGGELGLRVLCGALCGALIGFERARDHKNTGIRTLGLVGLGTSLLVAAVELAHLPGPNALTHVVQGVVTGVGFLGAGVILHGRGDSARDLAHEHAHGMTTAAAIWVTAVLGIVAGLGLLAEALICASVATLILLAGHRVDRNIERRFGRDRAPPRDPQGR